MAAIDFRILKMAFLIQRFICLRHDIVVLYISSHINNVAGNNASLFINTAIRCLYKAILIDTGKSSKVRNQADVRAFRCLNRAHTAVMGIVHITHFKSCTITGQAPGAESRETALMCQLSKRICLVHELRQRRRTEKLFNCSNNRTNINKGMRCQSLQIL